MRIAKYDVTTGAIVMYVSVRGDRIPANFDTQCNFIEAPNAEKECEVDVLVTPHVLVELGDIVFD